VTSEINFMAQSTCRSARPLHVAIIMDGNGRWAQGRGLARSAGHRRGAEAVRRTIEATPELGIGTLTLFAFSSDNWKRPRPEVEALMGLFLHYLESEAGHCRDRGIRLCLIGRRDRLPRAVRRAADRAEALTAAGSELSLRIALDYSSRDAILRAARRGAPAATLGREAFGRLLADDGAPDVDLLVRTGGERRLSDFLLWESAYAELHFTPTPWPEFSAADLEAAVLEFRRRNRRFGGLPARQTAVAG
jgi:undecaprenyl diphosphate synthase